MTGRSGGAEKAVERNSRRKKQKSLKRKNNNFRKGFKFGTWFALKPDDINFFFRVFRERKKKSSSLDLFFFFVSLKVKEEEQWERRGGTQRTAVACSDTIRF